MDYSKLATEEIINKTIDSLKQNGMTAEFVADAKTVKQKVLDLIPAGAEIMTMTSITLQETGLAEEINNSKKYHSVRTKLTAMARQTQGVEMQKLGAAPEWAIGSVQAISEDGQVFIASNTGSQLPAYVYGSAHVIWVVGVQKIVKDMTEAMERIYEYVAPKETLRAKAAYNLPDFSTNVSKLLIVSKEVKPARIHIFFVNELLGF